MRIEVRYGFAAAGGRAAYRRAGHRRMRPHRRFWICGFWFRASRQWRFGAYSGQMSL